MMFSTWSEVVAFIISIPLKALILLGWFSKYKIIKASSIGRISCPPLSTYRIFFLKMYSLNLLQSLFLPALCKIYRNYYNNFKYHVSCTDGKISVRINLLFYIYFPPSSHLTFVCFYPVGFSLLIQHFQQVLWVLKLLLSPGLGSWQLDVIF